MVYEIAITPSAYKAFKKYSDINDKISNFLYKDDNINKYRNHASIYLTKVLMGGGDIAAKDYTNYYSKLYDELYDLFKGIIPELIQEEREKKLNKILVDKKN